MRITACLLPLFVLTVLVPCMEASGGNWSALVNKPAGNVNVMILLSDGTVMAANVPGGTNIGNAWYRLTPDANGSYVSGTWTTMPSMGWTRRFFSSVVLRDGRVLVAGAEYGTGWNTAEVFDPVANSWTPAPIAYGLLQTNNNPQPPSFQNTAGFTDSVAKILPDGTVLVAPNFPATKSRTLIFSPYTGTWSAGPALLGGQNEASWVKLPDDSILTVDKSSTTSERYIPALNTWIADADVGANLYDAVSELGAGIFMQNGKAIFLGGNGNTAIYTPSGNTNRGGWVAGPVIPGGLGAHDAPATMMSNGKILCAMCPGLTNQPTSFFEYDPVANAFTSVAGPPIGTNLPSYQTMMLDLPDGNVLYSCETNNQLFVYQPGGPPLEAGKPAISGITANGDGSYHLTGTGLNGISEGAGYGDDAQMDSNYPLVRATDGGGNIFYLPTYNWNSTGVRTGNKLVSTEFVTGFPPGTYSLVAVANGISSDPVTFYGPVWVDFNASNPTQLGTSDLPYHSMGLAVGAAPATGTIKIKTTGHTPETTTITKPLTIIALGGPATIGR